MKGENIPLLEVRGLKKHYPIKKELFSKKRSFIYAVEGVDFIINEGETLGLVGESGCGKSTIGRQIVGLETPTEGEIIYQNKIINDSSKTKIEPFRRDIQMIFQDSYASLNPKKTIQESIAAPMIYHQMITRKEKEKEVERLLDLVGLSKSVKKRYPHEFSGGQRQRIGIARALSLKPRLIVCDEPVSALDVSIQAQILNLLKALQKELGLSYLFIGHGLDAVHYISDRIAVMYLGKIVEMGSAKEVFKNPLHPYTKALCSAVPIKDPTLRDREKILLEGEIPSNTEIPKGCRFASRCPYVREICKEVEPKLKPHGADSSHTAACLIMDAFQEKGAKDA